MLITFKFRYNEHVLQGNRNSLSIPRKRARASSQFNNGLIEFLCKPRRKLTDAGACFYCEFAKMHSRLPKVELNTSDEIAPTAINRFGE